MAETPGALQLRLLQTVVEVAAEKNSTLVMPFPVEMLRFFERMAVAAKTEPAPTAARPAAAAQPDAEPAPPDIGLDPAIVRQLNDGATGPP
jgi:hypothetical protein